MALGAEHGQPAPVDDLLVLVGDLAGLVLDGRLSEPSSTPREGLERVHALGPQRLLGQVLDVAPEHVDAAAGHVGGHGDGAQPAGLGDDVGLALVVLGVEDLGLDARFQQAVDPLGLLDGHGADQDGAGRCRAARRSRRPVPRTWPAHL